MSNSITKQITFTPTLIYTALLRARLLGISFPEYIRNLIVQDTKDSTDKSPLIYKNTEKYIRKALKDFKKGNFITLKTDNEIDDYFTRLEND